MAIGEKTIDQAKYEIGGMLDLYHESINKAYLQCDNELTVSISLKFVPGKPANSVEMTVGLSYVESKVKVSQKVLTDEKQMELFND